MSHGPGSDVRGSPERVSDDHTLTGSSWHAGDIDVDAHLALLGVEAGAPDLALLERLHDAHVRTLPFANVDVLLRRHPGIDPVAVSDRLLVRRRGGYCFEHAQLFAATLERLGYDVVRRLGRVRGPDSSRTHMTVEARIEGRRYLTDPGFGDSLTGPIELVDGATRRQGDATLMVRRSEIDGVEHWELSRDGVPMHMTDTFRVRPVDVRMGHLMTSTDPLASPFTRHLVVARHEGAEHVQIVDRTRIVRRDGREVRRDSLSSPETLEAVRALGVDLTGEDGHGLSAFLDALDED